MSDEWTRENQIKRMTLRVQILMPHMVGMSIFSSLALFILSNSLLKESTKSVPVTISVIALICLFFSLLRGYTEVDKIFQS